jgi:hypothetical protein
MRCTSVLNFISGTLSRLGSVVQAEKVVKAMAIPANNRLGLIFIRFRQI